jgi:MFS family permease
MADTPSRVSNAYRTYLVILLATVSAFNYVDRLALGIVLESVKADLGLSDTQLGLLGGLAFALFYSLMGVPIARWADRGNRVRIIGLTTALWSGAVALCGAAGSFAQLLLIRVGVAVGEAGCQPPAMSLLADYFSRSERPRANAIYALGGPIGCLIGFFVAGLLNELVGWRLTFAIMGLPGLLLALIVVTTLNEPRQAVRTAAPLTVPTRMDVVRVLGASRSFIALVLTLTLLYFFMYGLLQWLPTFFVRSYKLSFSEVGLWFSLCFGFGGIAGLYAGGRYCMRFAANQERKQLRFMAVAILFAGLTSGAIYLTRDHRAGFAFLALHVVALNCANAPLLSTIQTIVPGRMRATAFALIFLFANLVGMGLGPLAVGALSDMLSPSLGAESLRMALLIFAPGYLIAAWQAWSASRTVTAEVDSLAIEPVPRPLPATAVPMEA